MSIEVPVSEGDEAISLSQEELGQSPKDYWWFSLESTCSTSVFPKDIDEVWFLDQAIWREEHRSKYDLKKPTEECEDPECRDHAVIRISQIKEKLQAGKEEVKNAEVVMTTLNGLPRSWDSFIQVMCARRKWLLSVDSGKRTHNKRIEDGSNWRSISHHPKRSLNQWGIWRTQLLKNLLSTLAFG